MSIREKQLAQAAITTSDVTVYTCPAAKVATMKDFDVCNTTAGPILVRAHVVPEGGAAGTDNALLYDLQLLGGATAQWSGTQVMEAGGFLSVKADAAGCTITASGVERDL